LHYKQLYEENMNNISLNLAPENPDAIANRLINKMEFRDGLQEIAIGLFILIYAALSGLQAEFKLSWSFSSATPWTMMVIFPVLGFAMQWAIKKVRKRFLAGKTGYVELKPVNRKQVGIRLGFVLARSCVIGVVATLAMCAVVVATVKGGGVAHWSLFAPAGWGLAGIGIVGGAFMVFRVRLLRYAIGGAVMAALGILLAFSRVSFAVGSTILYGFPGLLALTSGSIVFFLFLRQPPESDK
jgi:hypothetical protein